MNDKDREMTRFEWFTADAKRDIQAYREKLKGDGTFSYVNQVIQLETFGKKLNRNLFIYLFGERLGDHLNEKFVIESHRNLLAFLSSLTSEYQFFLLHELKNNESLYAHC